MAFSTVKTLSTVLSQYHRQYKQSPCLIQTSYVVPLELTKQIQDNINELPCFSSEAYICETIIFPILKAIWQNYKQVFMLWSHPTLVYKETVGYPDYLFAKLSSQGKIFLETPFLAVIEAKKDDFTGGWGQCSQEMCVLQEMNVGFDFPILGIVSNGDIWQFAFLENDVFTQCSNSYTIQQLDLIYNFIISHLELVKTKLENS
jgi:hypothetical protein